MSRETPSLRGEYETLIKNIDRIEPVLEMEGEFKARDIDLPDNKKQGVMGFLANTAAIERVNRKNITQNGSYYNVYKWNREIKDRLKAYVERQKQFSDYLADGCDCRTHINKVAEDRFKCKHCGQEYNRDQITQIEV